MSSDVRALQSPHGRKLRPGAPFTPLPHGLFPNWLPGKCDLSKEKEKVKSDGAESVELDGCCSNSVSSGVRFFFFFRKHFKIARASVFVHFSILYTPDR